MNDRIRHFLNDLGLLSVRLALAAVFLYHGSQKVFGLFGGPGLAQFGEMLGSQGFPMPQLSAYLAGGAEFFGGLAMLLGVLTRLAAIPLMVTMAVAAFKVHGQAFSLEHGGMEYALTLLLISLGLFFTGPGRISLDALIWRKRSAAAPTAIPVHVEA
jgi:putative oxidoreductase